MKGEDEVRAEVAAANAAFRSGKRLTNAQASVLYQRIAVLRWVLDETDLLGNEPDLEGDGDD